MRGLAEKLGLDHPAFRESDEEIAASALPEGWSLAELMADGWRKSPTPRPAIATRARAVAHFGWADHRTSRRGRWPAAASHAQVALFPQLHLRQHAAPPAGAGCARRDAHADDAARLGLRRGSGAARQTVRALFTALLKVSDGVRPGIASFEGKWWENGAEDAPAMNRLTPSLWSPAGPARLQ